MLSETKVALPQLSAFIDPAAALLAAEADALDNDIEDEEGSPPDAMVLLDLTLGAATAFEGSLSAPVPHGTAVPSGWIALEGATEVPLGEAMVKRVDHVLLLATDDANW